MRIALFALVLLFGFVQRAFADSTPACIGFVGPLSGDSASFGSEMVRALQIGIDDINAHGIADGQKVTLVAQDDDYDIRRSLQGYEYAVHKGCKVIFVATYGGVFALARRPEKDDVLAIDTFDCNGDIVKVSKNHACLASMTESIADNFVAAVGTKSSAPVAVLFEEEAWFRFIVDRFAKALGSRALLLTVPTMAGSYRAELLEAKNKGASAYIFFGSDSMGKALAEARQLGIKDQFLVIAGALSPGFMALAGSALDGAIISSWQAPQGDARVAMDEQYKKRFGTPPQLDFVYYPTSDAIMALAKVLPVTGLHSGAEIKKALHALPEFPGLSGTIKFDQDGAVRTVRETLYKITLKDGAPQLTPFKP